MRRDRGSAAVELVGMLPLLLLAAVLVWQALLVTSVTTAAEHAARNASRAAAMGDAAQPAALAAMPAWLRDDARVQRSGPTAVTVEIGVPLVAPGVSSPWRISRAAVLPRTG
jgi:pilus assembly protein CpaE